MQRVEGTSPPLAPKKRSSTKVKIRIHQNEVVEVLGEKRLEFAARPSKWKGMRTKELFLLGCKRTTEGMKGIQCSRYHVSCSYQMFAGQQSKEERRRITTRLRMKKQRWNAREKATNE